MLCGYHSSLPQHFWSNTDELLLHALALVRSMSQTQFTSSQNHHLVFENVAVCCTNSLPCLCIPVKMRVGTETEKFCDSLWVLQAECTGLLWVERHPWARGDLGQSAHKEREREREKEEREEDAGPIWTHAVRNITNPNVGREERDADKNQDNTTLQYNEKGDRKEKDNKKRGVFPLHLFALSHHLNSCKSHRKLHNCQLQTAVSHADQGCKRHKKKRQRLKQRQ